MKSLEKKQTVLLRNSFIIMPVHLPWQWSTDYYNQTANILARQNTVYCFLWREASSIKELILERKTHRWLIEKDNLHFFIPLHMIPFRRFEIVRRWNMAINFFILNIYLSLKYRTYTFQKKILWIFYPEFSPLLQWIKRPWISIYDCVDYVENERIRNQEYILIKHVSYMFVNSHALRDLHASKRQNICLVPQGFRLDVFKHPKKIQVVLPKDKPLIGYIGGINKRLDFRLLFSLIKKNPQWNFVFWGPIQIETEEDNKHIQKLLSFPNVIYGESPKEELPSIISQFDIAIIPYTKSNFNYYSFPMKFFEYLYEQKRIISSPIKELTRYPDIVTIAQSENDWSQKISYFLKNKSLKKNYKAYAIQHSWEEKIKRISQYINDSL
ncbi:MAG: hypothetical protein N3A54_06845 [Patescibacteria group bacterium]|nr:hypothetical protein [Patescibacteria group bacterium]